MRQTLYLAGLLLLLSCSKDESFKNQEFKQHKTQDYAQFEYYESPDNPNEVLQQFIDNDPEGDMSINESVWHLEGAINFYFRHLPYDYSEVKIETHEFRLNLSDQKIQSTDLKNTFTELLQGIQQVRNASNNEFQIANVSVAGLDDMEILLNVEVVYFKDAIAVTETFPVNATADRHNYLREHCNTNTAPDSGFVYIGKLAYRKLFNQSGIPVYVYHYGLNIRSYRDIHYPKSALFIFNGSNLFGRSNDQIYPFGGTHSCQEITELNLYRDVVVNDVSSIYNSNEVCHFVKLKDDHSTGGKSSDIHYYVKIIIGEYGTAVQANPSI